MPQVSRFRLLNPALVYGRSIDSMDEHDKHLTAVLQGDTLTITLTISANGTSDSTCTPLANVIWYKLKPTEDVKPVAKKA